MQYFNYLIVTDKRYEEAADENCSPAQGFEELAKPRVTRS